MSRPLRLLIGIVALVAAAAGLLHSHPLFSTETASSNCVVCASAVRITPAAPSLAAPHIVVYALSAAPAPIFAAPAPLTLPSRAPPAA